MQLRWTKLFSSLIATLALAASAHAAPSFDCAKATTPIEHAISGSPDLGDLDARLAAALKDALGQAGASRDDLLRQQRDWLAKRNECAKESDAASLSICLQKSYTGQINQLRLFKSPLARASVPLCRAFADRIETLYQNDPNIFASTNKSDWFGRSALDVISGDKASGLVMNIAAPAYSTSRELLDAFSKAVRPASLADNTKAILNEDSSASPYLYHLPQTDLYVAGAVEGTAACTTHTWFEIRGGRVEPMSSSEPDDEEGLCGVETDELALFNNLPVRMTLNWDATPALSSRVEIGARVDGVWAPACALHFDFAPKFDLEQALNGSEKNCSAQNCSKLYEEAKRLVIAVQSRQSDHSDDAPKADAGAFEKMKLLWRKDHPAPDSTEDRPSLQQPDEALDNDPVLVPAVVDGQPYLATLGHRTVGWRTYSDWEVQFWRLAGEQLQNVAMTTVGMARGRLLRVNIVEPVQ